MNFRILSHLFATECHRLKKPVILLWVLIAAAAALSIWDDRGDFSAPSWNRDGAGSSDVMQVIKDWREKFPISGLLATISTAASVLSCATAAAIGANSKTWLRVSPARPQELAGARILALLLLLVIPGAAATALNLAFHQFSAETILRAALSFIAGSLALTGVTALFAAWCGSLWRWLMAMFTLVIFHWFLGSAIPSETRSMGSVWRVFGRMWEAGSEGIFGLLVAGLLLSLAFPFVRRGMPLVARGAVAVTVLAASLAYIQPAAIRWMVLNEKPPARFVPVDGLKAAPVARGVSLTGEPAGRRSGIMSSPGTRWRVTGAVRNPEPPTSYGISWRPEEGRISKDGKTAARVVPPLGQLSLVANSVVDWQRGFSSRSSYFVPDPADRATIQEIAKALPRNIPPVAEQPGNTPASQLDFGTVVPVAGGPEWIGNGSRMETPLRGTAFRYQKILDVPLGRNPVTRREGEVVYRVRGTVREGSRPMAELFVTHPSLGISEKPEFLDWAAPPTIDCRVFIHYPASGKTYALEQSAFVCGPLLFGAGWHRQVYELSRLSPRGNEEVRYLNTDGARLILLRPIVLGSLPRANIQADLDPITRNWRIQDYATSAKSTNLRTTPTTVTTIPDPATADRIEVSRWMRREGILDQVQARPGAANLALFAPRLTPLLLNASDFPAAAEAIRLGSPEVARNEIISRFTTMGKPGPMLESITARGWTREAAPAIRDRFTAGDLRPESPGVLISEDPLSYPALIDGLLRAPDLALYEKMRLLPGIEPALGDAIAATFKDEARLTAEIASGHQSAGLYFLAASDGNQRALESVLSLCREPKKNQEVLLYSGAEQLRRLFPTAHDWNKDSESGALRLGRKKVDDFNYDPLLRFWSERANH